MGGSVWQAQELALQSRIQPPSYMPAHQTTWPVIANPNLLATPSPCVQAAEKQRKKERAHEKKAESAADREAAAAASKAAAQAEVTAAATQASEQAFRYCPPALRGMLGRPLRCNHLET